MEITHNCFASYSGHYFAQSMRFQKVLNNVPKLKVENDDCGI